MKLYRFVFLFVMGCIACLALQPTQAQDDFAASLAEVAMYDEDAACLDEMMAFYFGEAFGSWFGEEEDSIQVTAAASSVSNVRAVSNSPIFVNVTWTGSHYKHKVFANDVLKFDGLTVPGGTTRSHQLVLSPSTTYRIKVVGYDRNGVETGTMTSTPVTTLSNVPTGVTAGSAGVGKAYVSWNYLDGMTTYKVYRSSNNGATWITSYTGGGNFHGTTCDITFTCPSGPHKFAVTATSYVTPESNKSTPASATIQ